MFDYWKKEYYKLLSSLSTLERKVKEAEEELGELREKKMPLTKEGANDLWDLMFSEENIKVHEEYREWLMKMAGNNEDK